MPRKKEKNKRDEDKKDKKYEKRERDTLEQWKKNVGVSEML
jgi:hypothetical protein